MDNTYPCSAPQQGNLAYPPQFPQQYHPQQYQPQQTGYQAPAAAYPPAASPQSYTSGQTSHMAYPASSSQTWQQAPPGQYPPHPGPQEQQQHMQQQGMYPTQSFHPQASYQQQHPQQQDYCQQETSSQTAAAVDGSDGSRGLGSSLFGAAHKVHNVEMAMHHLAHPVQGLKYHTVGKVKRKVKAKLCGVVDKVMP